MTFALARSRALIEAGDQIVVFSRVGGRGRSSGVEVDSQRGAVFTLPRGQDRPAVSDQPRGGPRSRGAARSSPAPRRLRHDRPPPPGQVGQRVANPDSSPR